MFSQMLRHVEVVFAQPCFITKITHSNNVAKYLYESVDLALQVNSPIRKPFNLGVFTCTRVEAWGRTRLKTEKMKVYF